MKPTKPTKPIDLYTSVIENNKFTVFGNFNCEFYWMVVGERLPLDVEPNKKDVDVKGSGPYRWIE